MMMVMTVRGCHCSSSLLTLTIPPGPLIPVLKVYSLAHLRLATDWIRCELGMMTGGEGPPGAVRTVWRVEMRRLSSEDVKT